MKGKDEKLKLAVFQFLNSYLNSQGSQPKLLINYIKPSLDSVIITKNFDLQNQISKFLLKMVKDFETHESFLKWNTVYTFMINNNESPYLMAKLHAYLYSNPKTCEELTKPVLLENEEPNPVLLEKLKKNDNEIISHYARVATVFSQGRKLVSDLMSQRETRQKYQYLMSPIIGILILNVAWISSRLILKHKVYNIRKIQEYLSSEIIIPLTISIPLIGSNLYLNFLENRKIYQLNF